MQRVSIHVNTQAYITFGSSIPQLHVHTMIHTLKIFSSNKLKILSLKPPVEWMSILLLLFHNNFSPITVSVSRLRFSIVPFLGFGVADSK